MRTSLLINNTFLFPKSTKRKNYCSYSALLSVRSFLVLAYVWFSAKNFENFTFILDPIITLSDGSNIHSILNMTPYHPTNPIKDPQSKVEYDRCKFNCWKHMFSGEIVCTWSSPKQLMHIRINRRVRDKIIFTMTFNHYRLRVWGSSWHTHEGVTVLKIIVITLTPISPRVIKRIDMAFPLIIPKNNA